MCFQWYASIAFLLSPSPTTFCGLVFISAARLGIHHFRVATTEWLSTAETPGVLRVPIRNASICTSPKTVCTSLWKRWYSAARPSSYRPLHCGFNIVLQMLGDEKASCSTLIPQVLFIRKGCYISRFMAHSWRSSGASRSFEICKISNLLPAMNK